MTKVITKRENATKPSEKESRLMVEEGDYENQFDDDENFIF